MTTGAKHFTGNDAVMVVVFDIANLIDGSEWSK